MPSELILIVEDSPTQAEALKLILESEGYEAEVARDGHEALERLAERPAELVLADVTMPRMDGYALCRALRDEPTTADVPVVMLSGSDDPGAMAQGMRAGVDGWLRKPVDVEELVEGMRSLLGRRAARRERHASVIARLERAVQALEPARAAHREALTLLDEVLADLHAR